MVKAEALKTHYGSWAVSTTPSDTFFLVSLFWRRISESVKPSESYAETPNSSTPPTTSTSSSSSPTSVAMPASVSYAPPTAFGPSGYPTGLSSPVSLSSNYLFGDIKKEGETSARKTDLLSAWDKLFSSRKMTPSFEILRISIQRTWLISYYNVDLEFLSRNSLIF